MATIKRILDLTSYATVLPYASEMFGVYQPLLGWKSKRIQERFNRGLKHDKPFLIEKLKTEFAGMVDLTYNENNQINIDIKPGELETGKMRSFDSIVLQQVSHRLPPYSEYNSDIWHKIINRDYIDHILKSDVVKVYEEIHYNLFKDSPGLSTGYLMRYNPAGENASSDIRSAKIGTFEHQLQYESSVAGALLYLVEQKKYNILQEIFYTKKNNAEKALQLIKILSSEDNSEAYFDISHLDPRDKDQLSRVALSPIGVVHLFRQYFFELDTFLGTPVSHVWLSPGSTTELIEIHTRKTVIEKTLENTLETFMRAEKSTTEQDEISDAVKENNQQDVKFGASVTASYASVSATSSFDYNNSQQQARETTHKRMRQQTEKLSSEIRKNFKSTFKTITEFTDVASTKHVLANSTYIKEKLEDLEAAFEILEKFIKRWKNHPNAKKVKLKGSSEKKPKAVEKGFHYAQVVGTYNSPDGTDKVRSLKKSFLKIIEKAEKYIYIEDQYLVNLDVANALNKKIKESSFMQLIIAVQDTSETTDIMIPARKRGEFWDAVLAGTTAQQQKKALLTMINKKDAKTYKYHPGLHAKSLVVDDEIAIIGSANVNQRSFTYDSETSLIVFDDTATKNTFAKKFREATWHEFVEVRNKLSSNVLNWGVFAFMIQNDDEFSILVTYYNSTEDLDVIAKSKVHSNMVILFPLVMSATDNDIAQTTVALSPQTITMIIDQVWEFIIDPVVK